MGRYSKTEDFRMADTVSKTAVLEKIEAEKAQWDALLAEVGEQHMNQPGAMGEWTFKDLVAHLSVWRQRSIDRLEAASRSESSPAPPWPIALETDDEINDWIHETNRDRPLNDVLSESRELFDRMEAIVQSFPEADLFVPERFEWMDGQSLGSAILDGSYFDHLHEEHEPAIREWLATGS
jgi:hypothetical protein